MKAFLVLVAILALVTVTLAQKQSFGLLIKMYESGTKTMGVNVFRPICL
jgi:hypothetical protein